MAYNKNKLYKTYFRLFFKRCAQLCFFTKGSGIGNFARGVYWVVETWVGIKIWWGRSLLGGFFQVGGYKQIFWLVGGTLPPSPPVFNTLLCASFFRKISYYILLTRKISLSDCLHWLLDYSWDIGQYLHCNCLFPGCDVINFEIDLIFLIKPFIYMTKMTRKKFKYVENEKSF